MTQPSLVLVAALTLLVSAAVPALGGFGPGGTVILGSSDSDAEVSALAAEPDGSAVAAVTGSDDRRVRLVRLSASGRSIGFGPTHKRIVLRPCTGPASLGAERDGTLVLGCGGLLAKISRSGAVTRLDSSLGGVTAAALAIRPDGTIAIIGTLQPTVGVLILLRADGTPLAHTELSAPVSGPLGLAIDRLGRTIVAAGPIYRYDKAGSLDPTFGVSGRVDVTGLRASRVTTEPDGLVVVGGTTILSATGTSWQPDALIARLLPGGTLDPSFGSSGVSTAESTAYVAGLAIQRDRSIVVAGATVPYYPCCYGAFVRKLSPDGVPGTFASDPELRDAIACDGAVMETLVPLRDGRLLAGGAAFCGSATQPTTAFVSRYTSRLTLDRGRGGHPAVRSLSVIPAAATATSTR